MCASVTQLEYTKYGTLLLRIAYCVSLFPEQGVFFAIAELSCTCKLLSGSAWYCILWLHTQCVAVVESGHYNNRIRDSIIWLSVTMLLLVVG